MSKAVAKREEVQAPELARESGSVLSMLQAIMTDPQVSVERVNLAFDFYQRVEAAQAKKAFDAAMADAKAEFDPIVKKHLVSYGEGKNKTSYKHEDLADISEAVDPALAKHGLNARWRATSKPGEPITVTCVVTHKLGYSEETTLTAGADNSGGKNGIQSIGSTLTYLQRYTKRLALGLAAARDDDGQTAAGGNGELITDQQADSIREELDALNADVPKFCEALGVEGLARIPSSKLEAANVIIGMKRRAAQAAKEAAC